MSLTDLRKDFKQLFSASAKKPAIVDVPKLKYLTYDGEGHPADNEAFQKGFEALFSIGYTLKFTLKYSPSELDFKVMPPEALYWTADETPLSDAPSEQWRWRLMIAVPDFIDGVKVREARQTIKRKKGLTSVDHLRLRTFREGKTLQLMHIGPYDQEGPTIERMCEFAAENGLRIDGKHHEIYCSDPRRTAPEKLKTILRLPVKKARA